MLELNSPAGDWDCLKAAVQNGADAVYLGTSFFNARRLAKNFKPEELKDVVFYAHLHHVKIYLTMNTLVRNEEIPLWFKTLEQAYLSGIDAVIIQEISFAPLIKKYFPGLRVHASTQASFMNYHGINLFPDVDLAVLARELSAEEIKTIRKNTSKKLEVFVHGHLCISYSGQCLISSLIGKRSGNRGVCASSCRKEYNNSGYLISAKDLMLAEKIQQMKLLGIDTVKIEGRMKDKEYVAATTRTYRKMIDTPSTKLSEQELSELKIHFNREFTTGFFANTPSIVGQEMPMNRGLYLGTIHNRELVIQENIQQGDGVSFWHPSQKGELSGFVIDLMHSQGKRIVRAFRGQHISIPSGYFVDGVKVFLTSKKEWQENSSARMEIPLTIHGHKGEPLQLISAYGAVQSEVPLQEAAKQALTIEHIQKELAKSGKWGIKFTLQADIEGSLFLPDRLLKKASLALEEKIRQMVTPQRASSFQPLPTISPSVMPKQPKLIVHCYSLDQVRAANETGVEAVYYDIFHHDLLAAKKLCTRVKFFLDTPVVVTDKDIETMQRIIDTIQPDGITIGNWGTLTISFSGEKHGKYSLNVFNDITLEMLRAKRVLPMISVELNAKQVVRFADKEFIYYAHGRIPVMHFKGNFRERALTDEKEYTFPLRKVNGNTEMLYSRPLATLEKVQDLLKEGVHYFLLDLTEGNVGLIAVYQKLLQGETIDVTWEKKGTTLGNYGKGVA